MYRRSKTLIPLGVLFLFSCATRPTQDYKETSTGRFTLIRYQYSSREITNACNESIARTTKRLDSIGHLKTHERTLENSLLAFEKIIADFGDETNLLTFMGYVSTDEQIRKEAAQCEEAIGQVLVSIFTRRDLYEVLRHVKTQTPEQGRLHSETLKFFEQNGLKLSEEKLAQVKNLKQRIAILETRFSANLNNDTSTIDLTEAELVGVPREFLGRFKKTAEGKFLVTTKSTDYEQIIENAINPETRKKMLFAYTNRQAQENTKILEEAILLRQQIAHLMGFNTWVDYKTWGRMAPDAKSVDHFLSGLVQKLKSRSQQDLAKLLHFKNELEKVQGHPPTPVEQWDTGYLAYQLRKRDYKLDDEKIREYFPSDVVMKGLFEVYSTLLGVQFVEVENANVWAPTVKLYKILDQKNQSLMAYFYTDMIPRPGKYGHAAAFTLVSGRQTSQGYSLPISAIVSNFNPPTENKPSLLNHDEVKTLFHEFGHIMHQTLTKAPYASLSGIIASHEMSKAGGEMSSGNRFDAHESLKSGVIKTGDVNGTLAGMAFVIEECEHKLPHVG